MPFQLTTPLTLTITTVDICVQTVILYTSVSLIINFFDSNNSLVKTEYLTLSGSDYTTWSNNDLTLIQLVGTKLNLEINPTPL